MGASSAHEVIKLEKILLNLVKGVMPDFIDKVLAMTETDESNALKVKEIQAYCLEVKTSLSLLK